MKCAKCGKLILVNTLLVQVVETYRSSVTGFIEVRPATQTYAHLECPKKGK